jgi:hypothetical protein
MSGSDPVVWIDEQVEKRLAAEIAWLLKTRRDINAEIDLWLGRLGYQHPPRQIVLLPQYFKNLTTGVVMANTPLPLNQSYTEVITLTNASGGLDPVAATDVFTATPSDTTNMQATVAPYVPPPNPTAAQTALAGVPALTVQWLHDVTPPLVGVSVTLTDLAGNTAGTFLYDMMPAVVTTVPDQITLDSADGYYTTLATTPV